MNALPTPTDESRARARAALLGGLPESTPEPRRKRKRATARRFFRLQFDGAEAMASNPAVPLRMRIWFAAVHRVDDEGWAYFDRGELAKVVSTQFDANGEVVRDRNLTQRLIDDMAAGGLLTEGSHLRCLGIPKELGAYSLEPDAVRMATGRQRAIARQAAYQ